MIECAICLHRLTSTSYSILPPPPFPLATTSLFSVSMNLFLFHRQVRLCYILCVGVLTQSCPILCDPMTVARQAPLSMGFSRQEYWSGFLCPPPGDLLDSRIEPASPTSSALADRFFTTRTTWEAHQDPCAVLCLVAQSSPTLCDPMDCTPPSFSVCPWDSPGENTRSPYYILDFTYK